MKRIGAGFLIAIVALLVVGFGIETLHGAPSNAEWFLNRSNNTFASPPCLANRTLEPEWRAGADIVPAHGAEIDAAHARLDEKCRDSRPNGIVESRPLILGLLFGPTRWTRDGKWRW